MEIEPAGEATHGACPDCGRDTRSVWGHVADEAGARAAYFVRWTEGHRERGAEVTVSIGAWGAPGKRLAFALECRVTPSGPGFMLVDAVGTAPLLGEPLTRAAALAHPWKTEVFHILDQIIVDDPRVAMFLASPA